MTANIIILKGSPREKGNSSTLADQAQAGAETIGAHVESFFLHGMDIRPCDGCDFCVETGVCVVKDDMQKLYPKLLEADALILASPIYWFTYSAQLKLCIDRWYAVWNFKKDIFKDKSMGVILTYGDTDLDTSGGINAVRTLESMFGFLQVRSMELAHGTLMDVGDAQKNPELMQQAYQLGKRIAEIAQKQQLEITGENIR